MKEERLAMMKTAIATNIKVRREFLQWSQADLAARVGMKEETIDRIEEGSLWLNMKQYLIILDALGLNLLLENNSGEFDRNSKNPY